MWLPVKTSRQEADTANISACLQLCIQKVHFCIALNKTEYVPLLQYNIKLLSLFIERKYTFPVVTGSSEGVGTTSLRGSWVASPCRWRMSACVKAAREWTWVWMLHPVWGEHSFGFIIQVSDSFCHNLWSWNCCYNNSANGNHVSSAVTTIPLGFSGSNLPSSTHE